MRITKIR